MEIFRLHILEYPHVIWVIFLRILWKATRYFGGFLEFRYRNTSYRDHVKYSFRCAWVGWGGN